jgi:hypothetical protein
MAITMAANYLHDNRWGVCVPCEANQRCPTATTTDRSPQLGEMIGGCTAGQRPGASLLRLLSDEPTEARSTLAVVVKVLT